MIRPNRYDYLKVLALLTMIIDHVGYFLYEDVIRLRIIGRIAFPLFLLLVGYNGSYTPKKWLRISAIAIQGAIILLYRQGSIPDAAINILLAILLTKLILSRLTKQSLTRQIIIFVLSIACIPFFTSSMDYGTLPLAFALLGWWMRQYRSGWIIVGRAMLIFIHMTYMIIVREFPSHSYRAVSAVAILLFFAGRWLYRDNAPLRLTPTSDILILWLSNKALIIYITHGLVLIAIALRRGYTG